MFMNIFVDVDVFTNEHIHVIDVRKKEEYDQGHIPGALFLDVKHDLSGENTFFPTPEILGEKLGQLGISEDSRVVIYDSGTQRRAAKAWVTLYYIGHHTIHILQGGYPHWENKGKHNLVGQSVRLPTTYHVNV